MRSKFPLFQSHLDQAKNYWGALVTKEDIVIDATLGNGHDSLFLQTLTDHLIAIDIQEKAITEAKKTLNPNVKLLCQCHSQFPSEIKPQTVSLIVYNLGYLPGSDKSITTKTDTTLISLKHAIELLKPAGGISITCYPGHNEGALEDEAITKWAKTLNPKEYLVQKHTFLNRHLSPKTHPDP